MSWVPLWSFTRNQKEYNSPFPRVDKKCVTCKKEKHCKKRRSPHAIFDMEIGKDCTEYQRK